LENKEASVDQVREKLEKTLGTKPTTQHSDTGGGISLKVLKNTCFNVGRQKIPLKLYNSLILI
jgi:hypothetical protein